MDADACKLLAGLCAGTGLSAACGFRVFVPLLAISVAVRFFGVSVGPDFAWIGSWMALLVFATATLVETFAYCIPWVDNALDAVSTPLALAAGALAMTGMLPDLHPAVKWTVGLLLGTGAAGVTQLSTVALRATSSAATGGRETVSCPRRRAQVPCCCPSCLSCCPLSPLLSVSGWRSVLCS